MTYIIDESEYMTDHDFMNLYEVFYAEFRNYLWPYDVLENLANLEVEAFSAFPDVEKLKLYIGRLRKPVEDASNEYEDEYILDAFNNFDELVNMADSEKIVHTLYRVEEVTEDEDQSYEFEPEQEDEDEESSESELIVEENPGE